MTAMQELIERLKRLQNLFEEGQPQHNVFEIVVSEATDMLDKEKKQIEEAYCEGGDWDEPPQGRFNRYFSEKFSLTNK